MKRGLPMVRCRSSASLLRRIDLRVRSFICSNLLCTTLFSAWALVPPSRYGLGPVLLLRPWFSRLGMALALLCSACTCVYAVASFFVSTSSYTLSTVWRTQLLWGWIRTLRRPFYSISTFQEYDVVISLSFNFDQWYRPWLAGMVSSDDWGFVYFLRL